jgi:hypothetical protein
MGNFMLCLGVNRRKTAFPMPMRVPARLGARIKGLLAIGSQKRKCNLTMQTEKGLGPHPRRGVTSSLSFPCLRCVIRSEAGASIDSRLRDRKIIINTLFSRHQARTDHEDHHPRQSRRLVCLGSWRRSRAGLHLAALDQTELQPDPRQATGRLDLERLHRPPLHC